MAVSPVMETRLWLARDTGRTRPPTSTSPKGSVARSRALEADAALDHHRVDRVVGAGKGRGADLARDSGGERDAAGGAVEERDPGIADTVLEVLREQLVAEVLPARVGEMAAQVDLVGDGPVRAHRDPGHQHEARGDVLERRDVALRDGGDGELAGGRIGIGEVESRPGVVALRE